MQIQQSRRVKVNNTAWCRSTRQRPHLLLPKEKNEWVKQRDRHQKRTTSVYCYGLPQYISNIVSLTQHLYQAAREKKCIKQNHQLLYSLHCKTINDHNLPTQWIPWSLRVQQWWRESGRVSTGNAVIALQSLSIESGDQKYESHESLRARSRKKHVRTMLVQIYVRHFRNTYVSFI